MRQLTRDGVNLSFLDVGKGGPPLVLVHGLAFDHSLFHRQIELFSSSRRVIAVDLRGHGASDRTASGYSVSDFTDDVAWLCYELGVFSPVFLGHGFGGAVCLELSARYPDLPAAVVTLSSPLSNPISPTPGGVLVAAHESWLEWDGEAAIAACKVPFTYVDGGAGVSDLGRIQSLCPHLQVATVPGEHLARISTAAEFNRVIEEVCVQAGSRLSLDG